MPHHLDWLHASSANEFAGFARAAFKVFGGRGIWATCHVFSNGFHFNCLCDKTTTVKHWTTFHQPQSVCIHGYAFGSYPPHHCSDRSRCEKGDSGLEPYLCGHNILLVCGVKS